MQAIGQTIFVQFPGNTNKRILHPCIVTQINGTDSVTVLPEDPEISLDLEQDFMVYFERKREFLQQPAKVEALLEIESGTVAALKMIGEPVSAESRQCYRVSTLFCELFTTFGGEDNCSLRDVSVSGFAVACENTSYTIGQVLDAELSFEGKSFSGRVSIQSIAQLPEGKTRYGVNCVKEGNGPTTLLQGVKVISMAVQRQQLSRLAGGA